MGKNKGGNKYIKKTNYKNLNPYTRFVDLSKGYFYYSGSFTTPPCTTNTHWLVVPAPVVVPQVILDMYRDLIETNPNNQLAPWAIITGAPKTTTPPTWNKLAGKVNWNSRLGSNNRPIQPMM